MLSIDDEFLLERSGDYKSYIRGKQYYYNNRVINVRCDKDLKYIQGIVEGSQKYRVELYFNEYHSLVSSYCTCPAYKKYSGDCKHIIALLSYIQNSNIFNRFQRDSEENIKNIIDYYRSNNENETIPVNVEFNYEFNFNEFAGIDESSFLNLRVGENKLYVVKNIKKFFESLENKEEIYFGKEFTFEPGRHIFKPEDEKIMSFLKLLYENNKIANASYYGNRGQSIFKGKRILLTPESLKSFFEHMNNRKFNAFIMESEYKGINIVVNNLSLEMKLEEENTDLVVKMDSFENIIPLTSDGEYIFTDGRIHKLSEEWRKKIMPLYNEISSSMNEVLKIPNKYKEDFISEVILNVKGLAKLDIDEKIEDSIYRPEIQSNIYLDKEEDIVIGKVDFIYGDITINPFSSKKSNKNNKILIRDMEKERKILKLLEKSEFKVRDGEIYIDEEEKIFDFVSNIIPELQELCDIYYSERFRTIELKDSAYFKGSIRLNNEIDMLEFDFGMEGLSSKELREAFKALKEKKKYYRLKDGSFLLLENKQLEYMEDIFEYLNIGEKDFEKEIFSIPKYRAAYLDNYFKEKDLDFIEENVDFKNLVEDIKKPEDIEYEIPEELESILRDYQKFGFKWLKALSKYGLGGILADDMGLGKTLQIITFLLSEKNEKGEWASIVVAPTSVVYNWESEIEKFAPSLKVLVVSGSKAERRELIKEIENHDVIITSYPLIRNDIDEYKTIKFRYCILDEAQYIKNPKSLSARSVKKINANNYFALTGTPMENSLIELWSIFDYLMPGYLLSNKKFVEKYEKPITREQDESALRDLNKHIRPFILRRLKKDVLEELPEKIEQKVLVDLTNEQKKVYIAYLQAIKGEIEEEIVSKGFNRSQIKILAGLTRLRQICCHPGMFMENYNGHSGKLSYLKEILKDAIEGGHRILLFSQFTSMLKIVEDMLNENHIDYMYLDGSTSIKERGRRVEDFNNGQGDVFLVSLKAGGTGLNLTGADTVIHIDPWWNPAVEEQATDRAYRMGQKNTVQVMKLITKGTIEEKIFELQERKKEMIDKVITEGETLVSKLNEDEIKYLFDI
ncbi:MAG: DEAD/DEAH box helicase [Clostridiaceae bacterium]|nr:DEAD/DEAH box helicase [Clostridiaceae bacterium]MBW4860898.1 DEAD/DEAH box helicase [Clostridiaceae bacterium]MBW4867523.1 DEAD/DEAH box helicase [Clostridiaceae bacterium]